MELSTVADHLKLHLENYMLARKKKYRFFFSLLCILLCLMNGISVKGFCYNTHCLLWKEVYPLIRIYMAFGGVLN